MMSNDTETLSAYLDGELDDRAHRAFEARLFGDPALMAELRALKEQDALLRSTYGRAEPTRFKAASTQRTPPGWQLAAGIAAALVVGVGIGLVSAGRLPTATTQPTLTARSSALQQTLESIRSGTASDWRDATSGHAGQIIPISTYRNRAGAFCREFEERTQADGVQVTEGGIACREKDGRWRVRVRYYL